MTNRNHQHIAMWVFTTAMPFLLPAVAQQGEGKPKNAKKKIPVVLVAVSEKQSQRPVTGAIVLLSVDESDYQHSPESDEEGNVEFTNVPQGQATVQATKVGWKTAGLTITLDEETCRVSIQDVKSCKISIQMEKK